MGKEWKQCQTLFFWAPKSLQMVTAAMKLKDAYSLEGKLWLTYAFLLKSRDITLSTKVRLVKAMVFPVVMYGYESWTVKKAEHRRIDAFELWSWRRLLRVPWLHGDSISPFWRRSAQDFFGRNDAKAETPVLWPPHAKSWLIGKDSCWEGLRAGGEGDDRGWDGWMASPIQWTWVWVNSGSWWWTARPGMLRFMGSQRVGHDWATELKWTEAN